MTLQEKFNEALVSAGVEEGDHVVVACSHGPDSLALAELARRSAKLRATIVYVDHGLRADAAAEADAVRAYAGDDALVVRVTVDGAGEDAARNARYAALDRVADELGARWILLGHTADDQAETVVARLIRGAGPVGLAGIPAARGRYLRPLLDARRAEIFEFLAARDLVPSYDETNASDRYFRNRVRNGILPALREENPSVDEALIRTARAMRQLQEALDWMADRAGDMSLAELPAAVAKRLLQRQRPELEAKHLDAILALVADPRGSRSLDLPGCTVHVEYGRVRFGDPDPAAAPSSIEVDGDDGPYAVRPWKAGDRMRLRAGSKKLSDLWTDRKIPRATRRAARVVIRERDGEIVWAEHIGSAWQAGVRVALTGPPTTAIYEDGETKSS
jgi:tRNA(Ile)-lysidine synthase